MLGGNASAPRVRLSSKSGGDGRIVKMKAQNNRSPFVAWLIFPGAYTVRYLFVICGFSSVETENLRRQFLPGRAPEARHLEPF